MQRSRHRRSLTQRRRQRKCNSCADEGATMKHILVLGVILSASLVFGQQPRQATLAQQKVCADQARKTFHADNVTRPPHMLVWEYTSHYEPRTNTCYIMTHFVTAQEKSVSISFSVYDAI